MVTFSTATSGSRTATLMATADPGGTASAALSGAGLTPAVLSADPSALGFGTVTTGSNPTLGVSIRNNGALDTGSLTTLIDGTDATRFNAITDGCKGKPLTAGSSCSVTVGFTTPTTGGKSARLTIGDSSKSVEIALSANAVSPGALTLLPSVPTFADVAIGGTSTAMISVKNNGGTTVTGLSTSVSGTAASDYSLSPNNCSGQDLTAGGSCTVTIRFSPTVAGVKTASFSVSGAGGGSASTSLTANATTRLTVMIAGLGSGSVTSNPVGVQCTAGSTNGCIHDFASTSVTLTATPSSNSTFQGWTGGGCGAGTQCTVSLSTALTISATFALKRYTVTVTKTGSGAEFGRVAGDGNPIDCGSSCSTQVTAGDVIRLNAVDTAAGPAGASFQAWSGGGCSGKETCVVAPSSDTMLTANFKRYYKLSVSDSVCNSCTFELLPGRYFSTPQAFDLDGQAIQTQEVYVVDGTALQVSAVPRSGEYWNGGAVRGASIPPPVDIVDQYTRAYQNPRSIVVASDLILETSFSRAKTITVSPSGTGFVTSIPPGMACPPTCTMTAGSVSSILLRADRDASWGGLFFGCPPGKVCEVTALDGGSTTITVTFP